MTLGVGAALSAEGVTSDCHSPHSHSELGLMSSGRRVLCLAKLDILGLGWADRACLETGWRTCLTGFKNRVTYNVIQFWKGRDHTANNTIIILHLSRWLVMWVWLLWNREVPQSLGAGGTQSGSGDPPYWGGATAHVLWVESFRVHQFLLPLIQN